jgi:hypothetical protein
MPYFATRDGGLDAVNFLSASSVCEWNHGGRGVACNGNDLVIAVNLGQSKHEEVIVLISKFHLDSPVYFLFRCSGVGD